MTEESATVASRAKTQLARAGAWRLWEIAIWVVAIGAIFVLPGKSLILTEIAILALFAVSLDRLTLRSGETARLIVIRRGEGQ